MFEIRRSGERGHANHGWHDSYHTFSFEDYFDPKHVEFGPLRAVNEDWVVPGAGFSELPHRDMEIIHYMLEGELTHKDSIGAVSVIRSGDVLRMSAGRGSSSHRAQPIALHPVHVLQISIEPNVLDVVPEYEEGDSGPRRNVAGCA